MASYSYRCPTHKEFTVQRSMKDAPLTKCIVDGCKCKIEQVFSSPMVKVNCSGFVGKINKD